MQISCPANIFALVQPVILQFCYLLGEKPPVRRIFAFLRRKKTFFFSNWGDVCDKIIGYSIITRVHDNLFSSPGL
jgi:hypothetical protein